MTGVAQVNGEWTLGVTRLIKGPAHDDETASWSLHLIRMKLNPFPLSDIFFFVHSWAEHQLIFLYLRRNWTVNTSQISAGFGFSAP